MLSKSVCLENPTFGLMFFAGLVSLIGIIDIETDVFDLIVQSVLKTHRHD